MALGYIYKVVNNIDNKVYIGATTRPHERKLEHFRCANQKNLLSKAIEKCGKENFTFIILEKVNKIDMQLKETHYINQLNSLHPNGYNLCTTDHIVVDSLKQKRVLREEDRLKGVKANTGKKRSEHTINLLSKARLGKPFKKIRKPIISELNGEIKKFESINEAASYYNIKRRSISNILNGWSKKTSKGIRFTYGEKV